MKPNTIQRTVTAAGAGLAFGLLLTPSLSPAQTPQASPSPPQQSAADAAAAQQNSSPVAAAFTARVKEYVDQREEIEGKMEKLPKDATPEQIEAHKAAFQKSVRAARSGSLPGHFFTREAARHIRSVIAAEFRGRDRAELVKSVAEAETKGVPLRVNYPYPEAKELVEMPPTLLLKLPHLPKQVKYRFVGRNLLLVDRENGLIIDYMTNALP